MTQEEKQLLLKDLCARLPYEVKILLHGSFTDSLCKTLAPNHIFGLQKEVLDIKPYLRPMSSMTEEEEKELKKIHHQFYKGNFNDAGVFSADDCGCTIFEMSNILNYLRSRHFDYCGLIPMGLALEASEGMYKNK